MKRAIIFFMLILAAGFMLSCSAEMTPEEKERLITRAENGDVVAQYKVGTAKKGYGSKFEFDDETRSLYFQKALDNGHETAIQRMIREAQTDKKWQEEIKWLNFGVEKGSGKAMYQLATMYLNGDHVKKDTVQALILLQSAAEKGITEARTVLREINKEEAAMHTLFFEGIGDQWKTFSGTPMAKIAYIAQDTALGLLLAGFASFRLFGMPVWLTAITLILILLAFFILFFVGYIRYLKSEYKYRCWKIKISLFPLFCLIWGLYGAIMGHTGGVSASLGSFASTYDTFWASLSDLMTTAFWLLSTYAVIMIIWSAPKVLIILRRILWLSLFCVYGFLVGAAGSIVVAIIIVISILKGIGFDWIGKGISPSDYGGDSGYSAQYPDGTSEELVNDGQGLMGERYYRGTKTGNRFQR